MVGQTVHFTGQPNKETGGPSVSWIVASCIQSSPPIRGSCETTAKTFGAILFIVVDHISTFELPGNSGSF
jgi:hypothetical protein